MQTISRSALVEHPASDMYQLVCDIQRYPEFLPWCSEAQVSERSDTHQLASVSISRFSKQSTFTTKNVLVPSQQIDMQLVDGPFRQLSGTWRFKPLGESACKVELDIEFEFASAMFARMFTPAFEKACNTVVDSFIARAKALSES